RDLRAEGLCERDDTFLHAVVDVAEGELGALTMHRLCDAPSNGTLSRYANNECALARQKTHTVTLQRRPKGRRVTEWGLLKKPSIAGRLKNKLQPREDETRIVSFWPGLRWLWGARSFQLMIWETVTWKSRAIADSV